MASAAALALTLSVRLARADDGGARPASGPDEVDVRGRRSQAAGFVAERTIEDAPREVTDAASLVEPLPGVHVRRLGADDSFATLSIRGSTSTQVAVFLAGVPLSGGADPTLDLSTLPLWPGARARVHRSFAPAGLGRGSLGGTLVIDPPSPRAPERTSLWLAVGSFGARRLRIGDVRGEADGVRIATGLSASRSDDDFEYVPIAPSAPTEALGQPRTRTNAGHAAAAGLVAVTVPFTATFLPRPGSVTFTNLAQARRQELPGTVRVRTPFQRLDSTRIVSAAELSLPTSEASTFSVRGWARREGLALTNRAPAPDARGTPRATDDRILAAGGSVGFRAAPAPGTLEVRIDGSGERFAPSWRGAAAPPAARRTNLGAALDASTPLLDPLLVSVSGRADVWFDGTDGGARREDARPTGNLGLELPLGPFTFASHGGFVARPPSFVERYGNRGAFLGNAALVTETAFTADGGGRFERRFGQRRQVRVAFEAAAFATWARDLITFVVQGADGRAKAQNIGRARLVGVEAELRAAAYGFEARASHTALATANQAECSFAEGACARPPLPGRPTHDFVADLAWTGGPLRLRYGIDVVSGIRADLAGAIEVPTRILHSAGAKLFVPGVSGLALSLDVRNLLDLRVAEYPGPFGRPVSAPIGDLFDYPLPGRRILLSLELLR